MTTSRPGAYWDISQSNKSPEKLAESVGISLDETTWELLINISDEVRNHPQKLAIGWGIIFRLVKFCVTHFWLNVSAKQILNAISENTRNHLSEMGIPDENRLLSKIWLFLNIARHNDTTNGIVGWAK